MKRVHPFLSRRALRLLHHQRKRRQVYSYYKPFRLASISYQQVQMIVFAVLFFKYKCLSLWNPRCQLWVACVVFSQFIPIKCKFCLFAATFVTYLRHAITWIKIFVMLIVIGVFIAIIIETLLDCGGLFIFLSHLSRAVESDVNQRTSTSYFYSIHVNFLCKPLLQLVLFVYFTHSWFVPK